MSKKIFNELAAYTNLLYSNLRNYNTESDVVLKHIKKNKINGKELIDVGCGGGHHLKIFQEKGYKVYGVELNKGMRRLARKNVPNVKVYKQNMLKLNLKHKADIIICMHNSINYNLGYNQLKTTLEGFYNHLRGKGLLVFTTVFTKDNPLDDYFYPEYIKKPINLARVNKIKCGGSTAFIDQIYIIYKNRKWKTHKNKNKVLILDKSKVKEIMKKIGFNPTYFLKKDDQTIFVGVKN